jgi:hypothetical protein
MESDNDEEKFYNYKKCLQDHVLYIDDESEEEWKNMLKDHKGNILSPGCQIRTSTKTSNQ